ncbi:hypothetical protein [Saccharopolyspora sp. CA-218241]|uniref:hypothetical protein n=1 Tax=Saccharopolyspora sp. CA-218241 TaxID=3240027 RepID=UPI003D97B9C5
MSGPPLFRRLATLVLVVVASVGLAVPATAAAPPSPEHCATTLRCDLGEIARMPVADRAHFVRLVQRYGTRYERDFRRWAAIAAVLDAQRDWGVGDPGSWLAVTGSGLLEALERSLVVARRPGADDFGNPGTGEWAAYLVDLRAGRLDHRPVHDREWGAAEQVALDHGERVAGGRGLVPTSGERRFKQLTDLFRWAMQHQEELSRVLGPLAPCCGGSPTSATRRSSGSPVRWRSRSPSARPGHKR